MTISIALPASAENKLHTDFLHNTDDLSPQQREIIRIDRAIFLELIKLARFNINFHQACNKQWVWRSWIYPIAQEAGTSCSFANTITDLTQRARGLENLNLVSKPAQKRGLASAIVGNSISGTASASELTQNLLVAHLASRQGYSPKDSVAFVKNTLANIDSLMSERQQLSVQ